MWNIIWRRMDMIKKIDFNDVVPWQLEKLHLLSGWLLTVQKENWTNDEIL